MTSKYKQAITNMIIALEVFLVSNFGPLIDSNWHKGALIHSQWSDIFNWVFKLVGDACWGV